MISMGRIADRADLAVSESLIYSDLITGSEPDTEKGVEVVRLLLAAS
jgi:hypothetical protein